MNRRQSQTLASIMETPVLANIRWAAIENLIIGLGGEVVEGRGSRVSFLLNGIRGNFHRPHPGNEAKKYQVRDLQDFLIKTGVET